MRSHFSLMLFLGMATVADGPQGADGQAARLTAMRGVADGVTVEQNTPGRRQRLERLAEPVYRFDDPARRFADGTVWAWCHAGRPTAVLTLSKNRSPEGDVRWLAELTSLAPGPIFATVNGVGTWHPSSAGVQMQKFPTAVVPADDAPKRLRQMKELVRQMKAHEYFNPSGQPSLERYELRVLPQPVHRYADEKSGLIDGGMFILSYGLNPEIVLLVEARRDGRAGPAWFCGFARIAVAKLHVDFDSKEIWSHNGGYSSGPADNYWVFFKPIEGE